jgi:4-hydroxyphenylpyruvate dioxygenase
MKSKFFNEHVIDYIEIYAPMAKTLAYWHTQALGFVNTAFAGFDTGVPGIASYVLESGGVRLVITSAYPTNDKSDNGEVLSFIRQNYCGVKRIALQTASVRDAFEHCVKNGAVPIQFPTTKKDDAGQIEQAAIQLYDHSEIVFINRDGYHGSFKPGYKPVATKANHEPLLTSVDHIASEIRINEMQYWTNYLTNTIGTELVQRIQSGEDNRTGMVMNINQSRDKGLTLVMAEPESYTKKNKVQQNIDAYGPGIHHLAFATNDLVRSVQHLTDRGVEFLKFPPAYYTLLRNNEELKDFDIDTLEKAGVLLDKEGDAYLFQKFIRPISDRPFFLYELVQRVNSYDGFALKNINVLKKAEEMELIIND